MPKIKQVTPPSLAALARPPIQDDVASDPAYTLFEQALVERSAAAWEQLYVQYAPLVLHWVQAEPAFALSGEEAQDLTNRAFEKMWRSLTPAKFENFPTLPALLQYLRLCVRSVVIDQARSAQRTQLMWSALGQTNQPASVDLAQTYCDDVQRQEFWRRVQACLKNEKERELLYYRYVLGIKPTHICEQYGGSFASPDEVYSMSQNILARLRRDPVLQKFLEG